MIDVEKIVKSLRVCGSHDGCMGCQIRKIRKYELNDCADLDLQAAATIEDLLIFYRNNEIPSKLRSGYEGGERMKVLVACEESQEVCKAFRSKGHEAYSCDIQQCSGGHPEWHIQADCLPLLNGNCTFTTADTHTHTQAGRWDLIIAHPPCTYLSCAGAERLFRKNGEVINQERYKKALEAADFFRQFLEADCEMVAIENPVIMRERFGIRKYDQIIEPYQFADPWHKRTCLWLKGLPKLVPTKVVEPTGYLVQRSGQRAKGFTGGHRDPKMRSKTFAGIAKAMAEQWGRKQNESTV